MTDYCRLFENSPDAILVHCNERITGINKAALQLFKAVSFDEIKDFPLSFFLPAKNTQENFLINAYSSFRPQETYKYARITRTDNSLRFIEYYEIEIEENDSRIIVARDISYKKIFDKKVLTLFFRMLSIKEKEYLLRVVDGFSRREIAKQMNVLPETADVYKRRILQKLKIDNSEFDFIVCMLKKIFNTDDSEHQNLFPNQEPC